MRRCVTKIDSSDVEQISSLYQSKKEEISNLMGKINLGRFDRHDESKKEEIRMRAKNARKGKCPVRLIDTGEIVIIEAKNFDSAIHQYIATNQKRSEETKRKMSEKSNVDAKGTPYRNLETGQIKYFKLGSKIPEGWVPGTGLNAEHTKNTIWINDGKKNKRIKENEEIPQGFMKGRIANNVFSQSSVGAHVLTGKTLVLNGELPPFYVNHNCKNIITFSDLSGNRFVSGSALAVQRKLEIANGIRNMIDVNPDYRISRHCKNDFLIENYKNQRFIDVFRIQWIPVEMVTQEFIDETLRTHTWI